MSITVIAPTTTSRSKKQNSEESVPSARSDRVGTPSEHPRVERRAKASMNRPLSAAAPGKYIMPAMFENTEPKMTMQTTTAEKHANARPASFSENCDTPNRRRKRETICERGC